ncbi:unnamed protein product [Gongylonema pulchrum]|uniref:Gag-pol polyprotein n=1 Tax=Gongylonema pulchrum TaxID=637853 RepID=A0A183CZ35_9BILA|nr:unnamed protein product [Gongylonema pulchrum]
MGRKHILVRNGTGQNLLIQKDEPLGVVSKAEAKLASQHELFAARRIEELNKVCEISEKEMSLGKKVINDNEVTVTPIFNEMMEAVPASAETEKKADVRRQTIGGNIPARKSRKKPAK